MPVAVAGAGAGGGADAPDPAALSAFLSRHGLDSSPENRRLATAYLDGSNPILKRIIDEIEADGLRILPRDVLTILGQAGVGGEDEAGAAPGDGPGGREELVQLADNLGHQALRLSDLARDGGGRVQDFARDIEGHISDFSDPEGGNADRALLLDVLRTMVAAGNALQRELEDTSDKARVLKRELEVARGEAKTDFLTGLANRNACAELMKQWERERRQHAIAFFDIDRFKSVNDRFGHAVGDRVLKLVGTQIKAVAGDHLVGRWGGEEFLLLCADANADTAAAIARDALDALLQRSLKVSETGEELGSLSFSAGVAAGRGEAMATLARADAAMYAAKEAGRARVKLAAD